MIPLNPGVLLNYDLEFRPMIIKNELKMSSKKSEKNNVIYILLCLFFMLYLISCQNKKEYDMVIYGATPAAITAAVQASSDGLSVIIAEPSNHIGGMTTGGLGWTDYGVEEVIGGLSIQFYQEVFKHYCNDSAWKYNKMEEYAGLPQALRSEDSIFWMFEPKVASMIFNRWIKENNIEIITNAKILSLKKEGTEIKSIQTQKGNLKGKFFIDCSYEGDLLAKAGVGYHVGRESSGTYVESLAGVLNPYDTTIIQPKQWFGDIDPYDEQGDLLYGISDEPLAEPGSGDGKLQAYIFRTCLTDAPENRIEISKPMNYDSTKYELLARYIATREIWELKQLLKMSPIPNRKTDINDNCPYSMDYIGANYGYPEGSDYRRDSIIQDHYYYNIGMIYFLGHDPRVPENVREEMLTYGLPIDEYINNGHWSPQLYIRESRRMIGVFVMTQKDCQVDIHKKTSIGCGSYGPDSHHCQRVIFEGKVINEGNFLEPKKAYAIPYEAILPLKNECSNLLVPVCLSASHVAFGSIRMEPVYMILGQSAAVAVSIALKDNCGLQEVDYSVLKKELEGLGQILFAGRKSTV